MDTVVARLQEVAGAGSPLAHSRLVEMPPDVSSLFPDGGARPGSVIAVSASPNTWGATSLSIFLAAYMAERGSWVAMINLPGLGSDVLRDYRMPLGRLVLVEAPEALWAETVGVAIDSVGLVVMGPSCKCKLRTAGRLVARARDRGCILLPVTPGSHLPQGSSVFPGSRRLGGARRPGGWWPDNPDAALEVVSSSWEGLGDGFGTLRRRKVEVLAGGRRNAGRLRSTHLWLPGPGWDDGCFQGEDPGKDEDLPSSAGDPSFSVSSLAG